jgi:hypothetical protein
MNRLKAQYSRHAIIPISLKNDFEETLCSENINANFLVEYIKKRLIWALTESAWWYRGERPEFYEILGFRGYDGNFKPWAEDLHRFVERKENSWQKISTRIQSEIMTKGLNEIVEYTFNQCRITLTLLVDFSGISEETVSAFNRYYKKFKEGEGKIKEGLHEVFFIPTKFRNEFENFAGTPFQFVWTAYDAGEVFAMIRHQYAEAGVIRDSQNPDRYVNRPVYTLNETLVPAEFIELAYLGAKNEDRYSFTLESIMAKLKEELEKAAGTHSSLYGLRLSKEQYSRLVEMKTTEENFEEI